MLRCCNPECRQQSEGFKMSGQGVNAKFIDKDTFKLIKAKKELTEDINYFSRYRMVCNKCGTKAKTKEFISAYNSPMLIFNTDNLCTCGGEIWNDIEQVQDSVLSNPNVEWEGSQRKVSTKIRTVVRCDRCNKEYE